ncbi:MAG: helix-turn-helix domain-containing protein [Bacteroidota bacterium]
MESKQVGDNIRIIRTIKGYSQEGLANKIGKSQAWLMKVEKVEIELSLQSINELANELDVTPHQLLFTMPGQIFNSCNQSGNYNTIYNADDDLKQLIKDLCVLIKNKL